MSRSLGYGFFGLAIGVALGFATGYLTPRPAQPPPIVVITPERAPTPVSAPAPAPLRVYVTGAVVRPDVYELPAGSIVKDAVNAAGGPILDANLDSINLAQELNDQQQVHVPDAATVAHTPAPVSGGTERYNTAISHGPVNINLATAAELEELPGIGPVTAEAIIAFRDANGPFQTIEQIQDVPGIGETTFGKIREHISVE